MFWSKLYAAGGTTLYCGESTTRDGGRRRDLNIEHVFPMGWVTRALGCGTRRQCRRSSARFNHIEADLHNLYPARADLNKARKSMPFAILGDYTRPVPDCNFKINERRYLAEPRPAARGKVARAMFYMSGEYDLPLYPRQGRLLRQWHRRAPPGDEERRRNDAIAALQGNRNVFIDEPQRAAALSFR